jgi:hypothetical protein
MATRDAPNIAETSRQPINVRQRTQTSQLLSEHQNRAWELGGLVGEDDQSGACEGLVWGNSTDSKGNYGETIRKESHGARRSMYSPVGIPVVGLLVWR